MKIIKIYIILGLLTAGLLTACSGDDLIMGEQSKADVISLSLDVSETGWHGETVNVSTRAGETMESLRATTGALPAGYGYGFGVYCSDLEFTNTQVTWDHTNSKWKIGTNNYNTYWQRNQEGTLNIYAYAPYKTGGYSLDGNDLIFEAEKHSVSGYTTLLSGNNVDLIHASTTHDRTNSNPAMLNFRHKLAKLTFGTVTNHTGEVIQLNGYSVKGTLNSSAKLNLATGVWSDPAGATTEIQLPPPFVNVYHDQASYDAAAEPKALILPLQDGETIIPNMQNNSLLLIPNDNGEIDVTVEVNNNTGENFSFPITLEEGKEKIVNITIGRNFEVVIE